MAVPYEPQLHAAILATDRDHVLFPQRRLQSICAAAGIRMLDLHGCRQGEPAGTWFRDRIHLTPEGHRVVAAALFDFLRARDLLH